MTLVSVENTRPAVRVGPKVFADVPTADELASASRNLDAAKRSRNGLAVLVVLLAGMLIASVAFVFVNVASVQTDKQKSAAALTAAQKDLAARTGETQQLQNDFAPYRNIAVLERSASDLRRQIQEKISQPAYGDAKLRTGLRDEWLAFENTLPWPASKLSWQQQVQTNLTQQIDLLTSLQRKLEVLPPSARACTDPRGCR